MADEYYTPNKGQDQNTNADFEQRQDPQTQPNHAYSAQPQQNAGQQPGQQSAYAQQPYYGAPPQNGFNGYYNIPPQYYYPPYPPPEQKANAGLAVLSWFIPLAGLVIYLTEKDTKPKTAAACGKCALASFIINTVFVVLVYVFLFAVWGVMITELFDYTVDYMVSAEYAIGKILPAVINLF